MATNRLFVDPSDVAAVGSMEKENLSALIDLSQNTSRIILTDL
jgi:hypothetical protein